MASDIHVTWIGADGSRWELLDPRSPVQIPGGIAGLHLPTFTQRWTTTARIPGRRRRSVVYEGRDVQFTVHVGDLIGEPRTGPEWRALDAAWWAALSEETPGTLTVTTARGERSLQLWLTEASEPTMPGDPADAGSQDYDVVLGAEASHWLGPEMSWPFEWVADSGEDFFGGADGGGYGPPFVIGGASTFQTATIVNPGEFEAYPRYELRAPFGSAVVGIGEELIVLPFGSSVGQQIFIDTDPDRLTILNEDGTNLWPLLGDGPDPLFAAVPAGQSVPVTVQMDAAGAGAGVVISLTPRYRRALS